MCSVAEMLSSWGKLAVVVVVLSMAIDFSHAQPTPFTHVDSMIHNFLIDELRIWDSIHSHANTTGASARNVSLAEVYSFFNTELNFNYGRVDVVRPINWHLAHYIEQVNRTQRTALLYLQQHRNDELRTYAEGQPQNLQQIIGQIFDETKRVPFLDFVRNSSDYCHPSKRNSHRDVYNMVTDFYSTVVEALLKGYMVSQMSYMVLGINGQRKLLSHAEYDSIFIWIRTFSFVFTSFQFQNIIRAQMNGIDRSVRNTIRSNSMCSKLWKIIRAKFGFVTISGSRTRTPKSPISFKATWRMRWISIGMARAPKHVPIISTRDCTVAETARCVTWISWIKIRRDAMATFVIADSSNRTCQSVRMWVTGRPYGRMRTPVA